MGIILSLAATFAPFWQTQVFPLLPEGRMCWCSCQGPTCCREEIKGLGRIRRVRTHTPEKHNSSHIHHPTKGTVEFFTEQEDGASRSSWIRPSEYAIWIPSFFSEHPSHSLVLGRVFFCFFFKFWQAVPRSKQRPLLVATKHNLMWLKRSNKLHVLLLITRGRKKKSFPFHCTSVLQLVLPCDASSVSRGVVMT